MSTPPAPSIAPLAPSPWHDGERAMQERLGVAARMEQFGRKVIRDFMPDQHRDFYTQLPFLVAGSVDDQGRPWACILEGAPGFAHSTGPKSLRIDAQLALGDPGAHGLSNGDSIGLLGIELHTRRRNRLNGKITDRNASGITIGVEQAFGNCPQYIHLRHATIAHAPGANTPGDVTMATLLSPDARRLIESADTFFVASYVDLTADPAKRQVDVSHRGGKPGFVRIIEQTLTIPDFAGNLHFNTLGNLQLNPRAGLLFADFSSGDVVQLSGRTELILDGEEVAAFQGAERLWRLHVEHVVLRRGALKLRLALDEFSPNAQLTGTWALADARLQARSLREAWRPFRIARIERESVHINSFHLEPADSAGTVQFLAGQHLPVRITLPGESRPTLRTYTLSTAPSDPNYRISVKREGRFSQHLHDVLKVGDIIEARAPQGSFTLDASIRRPAVLLSAGVGITPMLAMLRHVVYEGQRTRYRRPVCFIHAARNRSERAFDAEIATLTQSGAGTIANLRVLSQPEGNLTLDVDYDHHGHIDAALLKSTLGFDDYDFYLCGPSALMQGLYDQLRVLRVADERIHAEVFGAASLHRRFEQTPSPAPLAPIATQAVHVIFSRCSKEARWTPADGTLLELAEARGLEPEYSCRGGSCGTCRTLVLEGQVTYAEHPSGDVGIGSALICCALPAAGGATEGRLVLDM